MKNKNVVLGLTAFVLFYLIFELLSRIVLSFLGYSFFKPKNFIVSHHYKELGAVLKTTITKDDGYTDILILGGSVISSSWSRMDTRLDSLLSNNTQQKIRVFDVAIPGHTSLDNAIKYDLLKNKQFDLVIFYEAINENRANNIKPAFFKKDYSHIEWYYHINLLRKHPEINYTTLPYLLHKAILTTVIKVGGYKFIETDNVRKENRPYGGVIKTEKSYEENLQAIIDLSKVKNEQLLLLGYTSFFPKVNFLGDPSDAQYFAKNCKKAAIVTVWGDTKNVEKGINIHNKVLAKLANTNNTHYFDMQKAVPQEVDYFCDICHLSEKGCGVFAEKLVNYIHSENIFNTAKK